MDPATEAARQVALGNELADAGRADDAEAAYLAASRMSPDWSVPWYNLGLLCKVQGRWAESLAHNRRATELRPEEMDGWWNLGIAATAVGDWAEARRAWARCEIPLPEGDGPPETDFGLTPIRLDPDGAGEVVWTHRIDPARARIANIPLPTSGYRWGDVVLHDGAPEGHRMLDGVEVPVFNVLARLEPSGFATFVVRPGTEDPAVLEALSDVAYELGGAAENWGTSTAILCRECSLGTPHDHPPDAAGAHPHCGVAARDEGHVGEIIERWLADTPGADLVDWSAAPGPEAGS